MMPRFTNRAAYARVFPALVLAVLCCPPVAVLADDAAKPTVDPLQTIVVNGNRYRDSVPDEELRRDVKTALHDDPFFYDEHVNITVTDGIVHVEGFVLDYRDIKDVLRIIRRKFPHVKRVVNELEICREDSDDG
jgi:BON domain